MIVLFVVGLVIFAVPRVAVVVAGLPDHESTAGSCVGDPQQALERQLAREDQRRNPDPAGPRPDAQLRRSRDPDRGRAWPTTSTTCSRTRRASRRRCSPRSTRSRRVLLRPAPPTPPLRAEQPMVRRAAGCTARRRPSTPQPAAAAAAAPRRPTTPRRRPTQIATDAAPRRSGCAAGRRGNRRVARGHPDAGPPGRPARQRRHLGRGVRAEEGRAARPPVVVFDEQLLSPLVAVAHHSCSSGSRSTSSATPSPRIRLGDSTARWQGRLTLNPIGAFRSARRRPAGPQRDRRWLLHRLGEADAGQPVQPAVRPSGRGDRRRWPVRCRT